MFGEKLASLQIFTEEAVEELGTLCLKAIALDSFWHFAQRNPECIVVFDHTVRQDIWDSMWYGTIAVRTEAYALRAQLAIEGGANG